MCENSYIVKNFISTRLGNEPEMWNIQSVIMRVYCSGSSEETHEETEAELYRAASALYQGTQPAVYRLHSPSS